MSEKEINNDENLENIEEDTIQIASNISNNKSLLLKKIIRLAIIIILYFTFNAFPLFESVRNASSINNFSTQINIIMIISIVICAFGIILYIYKINKNDETTSNIMSKFINILEWVTIVPFCLMFTTFIFSYVLTNTTVVGPSMEPSIFDGERLIIEYHAKIKRFSVVVVDVDKEHFIDPDVTDFYIKRVIGLPGDTIEFKNAKDLYINGEFVEQDFYSDKLESYSITYVNDQSLPKEFNFTDLCKYKNADGNIDYCPVNSSSLPVIPEDYYFVLGDNRPVSVDSRIIGLVHKDSIVGVTRIRLNSFTDIDLI